MWNDLSQYEKIICLMISNKNKEWWLASDFMKPDLGKAFVGYEASARLSELRKKYPDMLETRPKGRFKEYKFRFDNVQQAYLILPDKLKRWFVRSNLIK